MARTPKVTEDRREQIIDAALRVFAEKGFVRATNHEIAREAGNMTPGLIYYYFNSKEDLLKAVLEERSLIPATTLIQEDGGEQPKELPLPLVVGRVLVVMESEPFLSILRVILPELLHGTMELSAIMYSCFERLTADLGHALHIQMNKGMLRADLDSSATAQVIVSSLLGMVLRRQVMRDPGMRAFPQEDLVRALLKSFH